MTKTETFPWQSLGPCCNAFRLKLLIFEAVPYNESILENLSPFNKNIIKDTDQNIYIA